MVLCTLVFLVVAVFCTGFLDCATDCEGFTSVAVVILLEKLEKPVTIKASPIRSKLPKSSHLKNPNIANWGMLREKGELLQKA